MLKFIIERHFLRLVSYDDAGELVSLKNFLQRRIRNFFYKRKHFKYKGWDGRFSFIDRHNRIPVGLWFKLIEFFNSRKIKFEIENLEQIFNLNFNEDDFIEWQKNQFENSDLQPRQYQIESCLKIFKWQRGILEIATAAGKTLIVFLIFAYFLSQKKFTKFLIVVPNVQLVLQTLEKFEEYNSKLKNPLKFKTQVIYSGEDKILKEDTNLVIGTYQSLVRLKEDFFKNIEVVCIDECHYAQAGSIQNILKKCVNADIRFGLSGTARISDDSAEAFSVFGLLGPLIHKISVDFLFQYNYVAGVTIKMIYLDYLDEQTKDALSKLKKSKKVDGSVLFNHERQLVLNNQLRFDFLIKFLLNLKKNTLVLFQSVKQKYGKKIYSTLRELVDNKTQVYYIDGQISKDVREYYRKEFDAKDGFRKILVASFGCFSQGIDIKNISYIFLVESYKSEIIILQSIGRGMRLADNKDKVTIIDLIDDYHKDSYSNYLLKHSFIREQLYRNENFKIQKYRIRLK